MKESNGYGRPTVRIWRLVNGGGERGNRISAINGFYETGGGIPGHYPAPIIYGPSNLNFALEFSRLLPHSRGSQSN